MKLKIRYNKNPHQEEFHSDITSTLLHLSCGFGCVRDSTLVKTQTGLVPISQINKPTPVLSWNEKTRQFELSLSGGAYPKGKANLYRVVHEHGEFVATEFHRVFCADYKYRHISNLSVGDSISYFQNHHDSNLDMIPKGSVLSDPHLMKKLLNLLGSYEGDIRRCGQLLLSVLNNDRSFSQSQVYAQESLMSCDSFFFSNKGGYLAQTQEHTHHDQFFSHAYMNDSFAHSAHPFLNVEGRALASGLEYIYEDSQASKRFPCSNETHHTSQLFFGGRSSLPLTITKTTIKAIEKIPKKEWFWDMHVFETNNYVTSDGSIHHNSGKSYGLVMKAFQLSYINKHTDGGLVVPTYTDFNKDMMPLFEDILAANNIPLKYHGQKHYFQFPWTKKKLWVATGNKKLRGPNWGYAVINELTLMPLLRYREVMGRVRDKKAVLPQIASVGTPEGIASEYYDFFIENPPKDMSFNIVYGDTRDNAENLSSNYISMLENTYDSVMLNSYLKGLWVNMNAHQFYYSYDPDKNHDKTLKHDDARLVYCAMDFNVDYMTATFWHKGNDGLLGFDEIVIEKNADTYKMVDAMQARGYTPQNTIVYPDPAGKARSTKGTSDHKILRDMKKYRVVAKLKAPDMRERQLNVNNLLDKAILRFNPDTMPTFKKDMLAVEQDTATLGKVKDNEKLTHASDGLDYLADNLYPFKGKKRESRVVKFR